MPLAVMQMPIAATGTEMIAERAFALPAMQQAWRKVRANGGAAGLDGQSLALFARQLDRNLRALREELLAGAYQPRAVLRLWVPKPNGAHRPISLWAVRDRIAQRAMHAALAEIYEPRFLPCSFGFRQGRGTRDAAAAVMRHRAAGLAWVVDGDILQCFQSLNHAVLMQCLRRDVRDGLALKLIERWLGTRVMNDFDSASVKRGNDAQGAEQGCILSPLLCNVYLHALDQAMLQHQLAWVRYADDWLILCRSKAEAEAAQKQAEHALAALKLRINPHKTRLVSFDKGFCFLGAFFLREEMHWLWPQRVTTDE